MKDIKKQLSQKNALRFSKERRTVMAIPIGATPVLRGKDAVKFINTINEDAQKPVGLMPTPKLEEARELIDKHAKHQQKHIR